MARTKRKTELAKVLTGIKGLDEITGGGLPKGRPTLLWGGSGTGKTFLAMEFLVRGALNYGEPGLFVAFEENAEELITNFYSIGFDLKGLVGHKKLVIDQISIGPGDFTETGVYDLEGLFIRLQGAIDAIGARRIALDAVGRLFSELSSSSIVRTELRRLLRWLKEKGITAVITAETENGLEHSGLVEYVSDCVVSLENRVRDRAATRYLRIVKYRGSSHVSDDVPFLIGDSGISVLPITSVAADYKVSAERIPTGIARLDTMLGGKGYFRGSSILVSGDAGTGKTSIAAHFAQATCKRGERCLFFAFEEFKDAIIRNMKSIGIDLKRWADNGLLQFENMRPTLFGLETHLTLMEKSIGEFKPQVVILDPFSNLMDVGSTKEVKSMVSRLMDYLKMNGITALFTDLSKGGKAIPQTEIGISSLMDTWVLIRSIEVNGEHNRLLYVIKSRGMAHSNQVREFLLTDKGVDLLDVYLGEAGVLTGSARAAQEMKDREAALLHKYESEVKRREFTRRKAAAEAQIAVLRAEIEAAEEELRRGTAEGHRAETGAGDSLKRMGKLRGADAA
jgi:circadian clock protein KaiC